MLVFCVFSFLDIYVRLWHSGGVESDMKQGDLL